MTFKRKYEVEPLTDDNLRRVTEINFRASLDYFAEAFGTPAILEQFLSNLAMQLGLQPDKIARVVQLSFMDRTLPPSKDELIEIYYKSNYPRRRIHALVGIRDDRITEVITAEESSIQVSQFNKTEANMLLKLMTFFIEVGERMI